MTGAILVTGGAGFIGSNFVRHCLDNSDSVVVVLDKLTYAGNLENIGDRIDGKRLEFVQGDIADEHLVGSLLIRYQMTGIVNLAAESHVDRSILAPDDFVATNVLGTMRLLRAATLYFESLPEAERRSFRFLHVSTDEVYGSLRADGLAFTETTAYAPNSPYAASKASADHLVRAWHSTYGLPTLITNCSNNYGPFQFPEKLMPLIIVRAMSGESLPVYGDGQQRRDWLHVSDHCAGILSVLAGGRPGHSYNMGGAAECSNLDVVKLLCANLDRLFPRLAGGHYCELIKHVGDRPGHDRRYAVDATQINRELGWRPVVGFADGIESTVRWYIQHRDWLERVKSGRYREWIEQNYTGREARS